MKHEHVTDVIDEMWEYAGCPEAEDGRDILEQLSTESLHKLAATLLATDTTCLHALNKERDKT